MQWMSDEEYMDLTGITIEAIDDMCERAKLTIKVEDGVRYIDPSKGATDAVVPAKLSELKERNTHEMMVQPQFIEKTIGTIINLHEKVLDAKDETLDAVRVENEDRKSVV